ncbi:MAG: hypothetical protein LBC20_05165 [Planctomycetaceae bacterium]|jgi:hypothetical protein|nr:hypothetical protein [Planctomycetaceae bacterium]
MAKRMDWLPTTEGKLVEMMAIWQTELSDYNLQPQYAWSPEDCTRIVNEIVAFLNAKTEYQNVPTKMNRLEKDEMKKIAVSGMRKFARESIRNNNKMTDAQKLQLGVKISDKDPTPIPVPDEGPNSEAIINPREPGVVKVRYLSAKPYGVDRIEIAWTISDTVLNSPDQLVNNTTFSKNPWEHTFGSADRGKKLYYSLRYLTKEGTSHWSDVREVIIP